MCMWTVSKIYLDRNVSLLLAEESDVAVIQTLVVTQTGVGSGLWCEWPTGGLTGS